MDSENFQQKPLNRNRIARAIFTAAESMGIRDRELVERLTNRVIERFEKAPGNIQPFPGMEDLVRAPEKHARPLPTDDEIEAMVKEILDAEAQLGRLAVAGIVTVDHFPWATNLSFIRQPVTAMEGCLVKVKTVKQKRK